MKFSNANRAMIAGVALLFASTAQAQDTAATTTEAAPAAEASSASTPAEPAPAAPAAPTSTPATPAVAKLNTVAAAPEDKAQGYILACQARSSRSVSVDA